MLPSLLRHHVGSLSPTSLPKFPQQNIWPTSRPNLSVRGAPCVNQLPTTCTPHLHPVLITPQMAATILHVWCAMKSPRAPDNSELETQQSRNHQFHLNPKHNHQSHRRSRTSQMQSKESTTPIDQNSTTKAQPQRRQFRRNDTLPQEEPVWLFFEFADDRNWYAAYDLVDTVDYIHEWWNFFNTSVSSSDCRALTIVFIWTRIGYRTSIPPTLPRKAEIIGRDRILPPSAGSQSGLEV